MRITYAQLMKSGCFGSALPKQLTCLGSWCLLCGPEQHLKQEALARLRAEAESTAGGGLTWETLDGPDVTARDLLNRSQTGALFGGARVIVVRDAEKMDGAEQEALAKAMGALPADVGVILVTDEAGDRRRRKLVRAPLRRTIEERGVVIECRALKTDEATEWAIARAKQLGKKLEPAAARKLVQQKVGTGLGEIEAELGKLALFVGDLDIISSSHVDEVSPRTTEEDVFRVVDAVRRRNAARAVGILRALLEEKREPPGRILWALAQAVRLVWQTKQLLEQGWAFPVGATSPQLLRQRATEARPDAETAALLPQEEAKNVLVQFSRKSWLVGPTCAQARAFSWERLVRAMEALHACDLAIKGLPGQAIRGKVTDEAVALELLLVQLCTDLEMPIWQGMAAEPSR